MKKDLDESLFTLLKTLPRFVDEGGDLVKTVVVNSAWNSDPELIRLLLDDAGAREKFFEEIEGHRVFNLKVFVDYVEDKNFLANSYTRFRNRIGLNIGDKFLHERGEVSLVWPYKDCVLEGGQTREEEKALNHEFFTGEPVDPDEGLELREEFVEMVEASIAEVEAGGKTIPMREIAENLGIEL